MAATLTLYHLLDGLTTLEEAVSSLFLRNGLKPGEELTYPICPLMEDAEEAFLRKQAGDLLESLYSLRQFLRYLKQPVLGEYTLLQLNGGRYGYFDQEGAEHSFTCGKSLEAKLYDSDGTLCWVKTRIEHNGSDYFLFDYPTIPLSGLTVRERGIPV